MAETTRSDRSGAAEARDLLFKSDRPRDIDRYIDYFGSDDTRAHDAADTCGEVLLERPA
jgi:hypothetical protein